MSLEHALHNEKTCNYLDKKPDHADWVITTAFYSSLHFVRHKIFEKEFEIEINNKKIKTKKFDLYYKAKNVNKLNKHDFLCELTENFCPEIADVYKQLLDASYNARYVNYQYSRELSNLAKSNLKQIKSYCYSEKEK